MPRLVYPLPEAIEDGWTVVPGQPQVNVGTKTMQIPVGDDVHETCVRAHEMAHVKWTPRDDETLGNAKDLPWDFLQAVEDSRMHARLNGVGVDLSAGQLNPDEFAGFVGAFCTGVPPRDAVAILIACHNTGTHERMKALLAASGHEREVKIADAACDRMVKSSLEFSDTLSVVEWVNREVESVFGDDGKSKGRKGYRGDGTCGTAVDRLNSHRKTSDELAEDDNGSGKSSNMFVDWLYAKFKPRSSKTFHRWGELRMEEPPLCVGAAARTARHKSQDYGAVLRNPHRKYIDMRVFSSPRTFRSASILIDCSGSMSITPETIVSIVNGSPATVIAGYSGEHSHGVLRVFARDGKRVNTELITRPSGGANVIDGPALAWLAHQPEPRIWMSDGNVTGVGDQTGEENTRIANELCKAHRIKRYRMPKEIVEAARRSTVRRRL